MKSAMFCRTAAYHPVLFGSLHLRWRARSLFLLGGLGVKYSFLHFYGHVCDFLIKHGGSYIPELVTER